MPIKVLGSGKRLTARLITMDSGSDKKPWIVFKSDGAGIWPIASYANEKAAQAYADTLNAEEDERCKLINAKRRRERKRAIPRGLLDDYFVKHRDDRKAPLL